MTPASPPEAQALTAAEHAYALVESEPLRAHVLAEEAVALARRNRDWEALVAALHALGYARYRLGDARAVRTMRAAVRTAERYGYGRKAALARRNVALYLAYQGKLGLALVEIDAACAALTGIDRARSEVFRNAVYGLAGRGRDVIPDSTKALKVLRRHGDRPWEARLAYNLGVTLIDLGEYRPARRDFERARELYAALGLAAAVADAKKYLALVASLEGDPVRCLAELEDIDVESLTDWAACWVYLNRAEALLALRLLPEARADLARFTEVSVRAHAIDSLNKARLDAARLSLAAGDPESAAAQAAAARRSFSARGQRPFAAAATVVGLAAALETGSASRAAIRAARRAAEVLAGEGWTIQALRAHALLARAAGSQTTTERELAEARPLDRRGTVADRVELRHAEALARLRAGDLAGAQRRLQRGLELLEEYRAALGAVELRSTASSLGVALARDGLRIALGSGVPANVLPWAERLRANALRLPPVRPARDSELRAAQAELRLVARRIREANDEGKPSTALAARQSALEATVRRRTRLARGEGDAGSTPDLESAAKALGHRALLEYVELDGRLHAVTLVGGLLGLRELQPVDTSTELEWLRFSLSRLARGRLSAAQRTAALANANAAAAALDHSLVEPLLPAIGDAPLVVVPTGGLHALPWSALPSIRGRPVAVAPSLSQWLALDARRRSRRRKTALVAGPRLRHAKAEIADIAPLFGDATVLRGREATADAVLAALDGASLAHLACHGRFRADSPLFSSLELADGPLNALDLQGLRRAPDVLVLSACDVALSERHAGDELLGLSAALLAMGTRTIVASVVPVPDRAVRRLLLAFHSELAAGAAPATALARAQAGLRGNSAALAGFVCLGFG